MALSTNMTLKALTDEIKKNIEKSLQKAKKQGLTLETQQKCLGDCIKKQGDNLQDFIHYVTTNPLMKKDFSKENNKKSDLKEGKIIFISASLPKDSLKLYADYAKTYKARLVLQGMIDNSMVKTGAFVQTLMCPVDIDPPLFKRYRITRVPVFLEHRQQKSVLIHGHLNPHTAFEKITHYLKSEGQSS